MKKEILILFLFFAITLPAYSSLLKPGMLTSHDGEGHIIRMFEFNKAISDNHFPVRWAKRLNWGLGYPFFTFNYPLIYYLTFLTGKLGLNLLVSFKLILLLSFPLSGYLTYLWLKNHFPKTAAFLGGLFYTLIPYHFLNVYVRGNLGETLALSIVPLNFYLVNRLYQKPKLTNAIWLGFCLSLVILTHNISALLFLPIILMYGFLLNLDRKYLKYLICGSVLPVLITSFFWLPALVYKQFITIDQKFPLYFSKQFPTLKDLLYSPWGYGGSKVGVGQMSVQIGLLHILIFAASVFLFVINFKKLKQRKITIFFFVLSLATFFMMLEQSKPIWEILKPIQYLQFPWRLLSILALTICYLASFACSFLFKIIPKKANILVLVIFILALLFLNRNHWQANKYYDLPSYWFLDKPVNSTTTVDGEHTPKWQTDNSPAETSRFEIISGQGKISSITWKTNYHLFQTDSRLKITMIDRTVFFPGWTVFINGIKVNTINQNDPKTKGLIAFEVPEGQHKIEVKLLEPTLNKVADVISLLSVIVLLLLLCKLLPLI